MAHIKVNGLLLLLTETRYSAANVKFSGLKLTDGNMIDMLNML